MKKAIAFILVLITTSLMFAHLRCANANPGVDLIVESITLAPANPVDGEATAIYATIKNIGNATVTTDFFVGFYLDVYHPAKFLGSKQIINDLGPGQSATVSLSWSAIPGNHTIIVEADGYDSIYFYHNLVPEDNETNNVMNKEIEIGYSDLIISEIHFAPLSPLDGETTTLYATVENIGLNKTVRDFFVGFYLDVYHPNKFLGSKSVINDLGPSDAFTVSLDWPGSAIPGNHTIIVEADGYDSIYFYHDMVQESNELNNRLSRSIVIGYSDYIVSDIQWTPLHPAVGEMVTFTATIKNVGQAKSVRDFYVGFYIDVYHSSKFIGTQQVINYLEPGQSVAVSKTWTATSGSHTVIVEADGYDSIYFYHDMVQESNELNNKCIENMSNFDASISLSAIDGYVGMDLTISGSGFEPYEQVFIYWDVMQTTQSTTSTAQGNILMQFTVPDDYLGFHDISASDGKDTSPGITFKLRQARVSTPVLYDPGDVDIDGSFIVDCSDATSELGGVIKYEFQRALSPVFTSPTTYPLRSQSMFELSHLGNGTYFFRVRAKDVTNELYSFWSNTESITVLVFEKVILTVRVSDNGNPIPNANVTVRFVNGTLVSSKLTNQSGYTTFILTPGAYNIASQTAGYSINQTINSDTLIVFDPLAKIPEFPIELSMLIVAIVSSAFAVLTTKARRKHFKNLFSFRFFCSHVR
jgi:subtilase family serine protease